MKNETNNVANQTVTANNGTISGNLSAVAGNVANTDPSEVGIKDMFASLKMQEAIRDYLHIPEVVIIKKLKSPYENKDTKEITQKLHVMGGTTIEDAISFDVTLLNTTLDPVAAVNKKYRLIDYKFALIANMNGKDFGGYAAKGLKVVVTRLEEVK